MKQRLRLESELQREREAMEAVEEEVARLQGRVRQKDMLRLAANTHMAGNRAAGGGGNKENEMVRAESQFKFVVVLPMQHGSTLVKKLEEEEENHNTFW